MSPFPEDADDGLRRFLDDLRFGTDRRSGAERRGGDRRDAWGDAARERRGEQRRVGTERRAGDRRHPPAGTFSVQDSERIRDMLSRPEPRAACPRCHGNLLRGPTTGSRGLLIQDVYCTECRHSAHLVWR